MNRQAFHRFTVAILIGLVVYIAALIDVYALETFVIGGEENSWSASFLRSGSTILVDVNQNWLQPLEIDPTVNLVLGYVERGGTAWAGADWWDRRGVHVAFDGDPTTAWESLARVGEAKFTRQPASEWPKVGLGMTLPVNRVVFYPSKRFPERFPDSFQVLVNDGKPEHLYKVGRSKGKPIWEPVKEVRENKDMVVDITFPLQLVKFLSVRPWTGKVWEIAEIEIYGEGFVPEASYVSDIIDFRESASWGKIGWSGRCDPDAKVWIQTRSGMDDDPNVYWRRTGRGDEITNLSDLGKLLTERDYNKLPKLEQGPITHDSENWSFWSAPYDFEGGLEGVSITSPGPRRFFQLRVDFVSTPTDGARIDFIRFDLSKPPAAWEVVAEIFPLDVEPGEVITFTYAVRPTIMRDNPGFDSLEIRTPAKVSRVKSVRIDLLEVNFSFELLDDPAGFVVHFPDDRMDMRESGKLLEVIFDAVVFRYGTAFEGRVLDSRSNEVPQPVSPGNATDRLGGDDLFVRTSLGGALISSVDVLPNPFTPNGDHINDVADISYSLLRLTDVAPVSVDIYSLSGAFIRSVYVGWDLSGYYSCVWDGTDGDGRLVAPGVYLYRVSVDADKGKESRTGTVAVVY